jgi:hypothetical protein
LTGSVGGPIIKNKTFFFVLVDKQFENERQTSRANTLTDCAQRGIFRYWSGWTPGNINTQTVRTGASPTTASVDSFGNPVRPAINPDGTPYTGQLQYRSVFGPLANIPTQPDCSDAVVSGAPWDANRSKMDPSGTSQKFLAAMPHANTFNGGDGLNTAVTQWTWRGHSLGDYPLASGNTFDANRLQFDAKVDHNFSDKHKVASQLHERTDRLRLLQFRRGRLVARLSPAADAAPSVGVHGKFHVDTGVQHRQRSTVWVPEECSVYLCPVGSAGSRTTQSSPVAPVARRGECVRKEFSNRLRALRRRSNERE